MENALFEILVLSTCMVTLGICSFPASLTSARCLPKKTTPTLMPAHTSKPIRMFVLSRFRGKYKIVGI